MKSTHLVNDAKRFVPVCTFIIGLIVSNVASACSVPVFRYALEHWHPDPYVAIVFHRGELSPEQRALVDRLNPTGDTGTPIANIVVEMVDLDAEPNEAMLELWKQQEARTLPLVVLQTPPKRGPSQNVWHGELSEENVNFLLDSPVRQQIREKLLSGDSVVWVLLESGNASDDDAAFSLLTDELARLQETIELPAIEEADLKDLSVDPTALKIAFSTIRVSRDDDAERTLIEQLLRVEVDLLDEPYVRQTMAFPVFARGRALYALVGEGITPETIEDASRFLAGACQCTVKAQNPGVDLLMAVDWDQYVTPALPYDDSEPDLAGLTAFVKPQSASDVPAETTPLESPETGDATSASAESLSNEPTNPEAAAVTESAQATARETGSVESLTQNITMLLGLMVAAVVLATGFILWKSR